VNHSVEFHTSATTHIVTSEQQVPLAVILTLNPNASEI